MASLCWLHTCACSHGTLLSRTLLLHAPRHERGSEPVSFCSSHTCCCCCWRLRCVQPLAQAGWPLLMRLLLLLLCCPTRILIVAVLIFEDLQLVGCRPDDRGKHALLLELGARPGGWLAAVLLCRDRDARQQRVLLQGGRERCGDGTLPCKTDKGGQVRQDASTRTFQVPLSDRLCLKVIMAFVAGRSSTPKPVPAANRDDVSMACCCAAKKLTRGPKLLIHMHLQLPWRHVGPSAAAAACPWYTQAVQQQSAATLLLRACRAAAATDRRPEGC